MYNKHQKCFFGPQVIQNKKWGNFGQQIKKRCFIYILIVVLFLVQKKLNLAANLTFFHVNLLVSNLYFWSTMSTEIIHTIVNIFSGILIVTVNV